MTNAVLPAVPAATDPTAHPGFATAKAWRDRTRPTVAGVLAAAAARTARPDNPDAETARDGAGDAQGAQTRPSPGLPAELILILSLARAVAASPTDATAAPDRITLIHGWADPLGDKLGDLLHHPSLARELLGASDPPPEIRQVSKPGAIDRAQADHRRALMARVENV